MKKEYDTFVGSLDELAQGQEIELFIRDLTPGPRKYDNKHVKAIVSSAANQLPEADILRLRFKTGVVHPEPWRIKIVSEL